MRVNPNENKIKYLQSIGVPLETITGSTGKKNRPKTFSPGRSFVCFIVIVILLLLLFTKKYSRAEISWPAFPYNNNQKTSALYLNKRKNNTESDVKNRYQKQPQKTSSSLLFLKDKEDDEKTNKNNVEFFLFSLVILLQTGLIVCQREINEKKIKILRKTLQELKNPTGLFEGLGKNTQLRKEKNKEELLAIIPTKQSPFPWTIGFYTLSGCVRQKNEDSVISFIKNECSITVMADGMGGIPLGREASEIAVMEAEKYLRCELESGNIAFQSLIEQAVYEAEKALLKESKKRELKEEALRTTLIITLINNGYLYFTYIGDGAIWVIYKGKTRTLLIPHKSPEALNILHSSLGPCMQGEPVSGKDILHPGSLVVISTDGIADRVIEDEFLKDVLKLTIQNKGDLQRTTEELLTELVEVKDSDGFYMFDDNLTMAITGTGTPMVSKNFWKEGDAVKCY